MTDRSSDQLTTNAQTGAADHLVILVHGINTRALWMDEVKPALESAGFAVGATSYGEFSILRFLAPFFWLRNRPVERVAKAITTAIRSYKNSNGGNAPKKMSVISHSFGTYIVGRLLTDHQEFEWYRVIFCGSVIREDYPLDKVLNQFTSPLLNEIGTRDFLPALAESAGWGYGSVGSTGFNAPPVETRWHHGYRHSDFLTAEFCKNYWVPFLQGQRPAPADPPMKMPLWIRLLAMLPLRWIILAIEALVLSALIYLVVTFVRTEAGFDGAACRLTPPSTQTPLREETANGVLNYLAVLQSQQRDEKFKQLYQDRFIRPDGWTGTVEDLPDAKNGLCRFMVRENGSSARIFVNTCDIACNYRTGDPLRLSGWLTHRGEDYVEIDTQSITTAVAPQPPSASAPSKVVTVCHGEHENFCKAHKFDIFEHCGDDNGVGGADPHVSARNICGNEKFEVSPAEGGSIGGNHCGYSWYRIACK